MYIVYVLYIYKISLCVKLKFRMMAASCLLSGRLVASCFSKDNRSA